MPDAEQIQLLRSIRGAPATILLLLLLRGSSLTNRELCQFTGYTDKTVSSAMSLLDSLALTQYNGRTSGWSLNAGQLSLPLIHSLKQPVDKEIGKIPICTTTATANRERSSEFSSRSSRNAEIDRKISDLLVEGGIGPGSKMYLQLLAADLDLDTVRAHVDYRVNHPNEVSVGLLIRRLLDGDPPPRRTTIDYSDIIVH